MKCFNLLLELSQCNTKCCTFVNLHIHTLGTCKLLPQYFKVCSFVSLFLKKLNLRSLHCVCKGVGNLSSARCCWTPDSHKSHPEWPVSGGWVSLQMLLDYYRFPISGLWSDNISWSCAAEVRLCYLPQKKLAEEISEEAICFWMPATFFKKQNIFLVQH